MKKLLRCVVLVWTLCAICSFAAEAEKENIVSLTIFERITLRNLLPGRESFDRAIVISDLQKKLMITQEEIDKYEIKVLPDGTATWNDATYKIEVVITKLEAQILKDVMKKLDEKKEIFTTDRFLALYDKIENLK